MSVDVEPTHVVEVPDGDAPRPPEARQITAHSVWSWTWPKLIAIGSVVLIWQILFWREWKPDYVLPSPWTVAQTLWTDITEPRLWNSLQTTLERAIRGYGAAVLIGTLLGIAVVQWK